MTEQRKQVTLRMASGQHASIAEAARRAGMTVNRYMLTCALARGHDEGQRDSVRALLREHREESANDLAEMAAAVDSRLREAQAERQKSFAKFASFIQSKLPEVQS